MTDFYKKYRIEILIFFVALLVRFILFAINFEHNNFSLISTIHGDDGYYEISQGILAGNGFTGDVLPPHRPNPLRPPVWPFLIAFLAKVFGSYWAVAIFELIIGSLIPVLGYMITKNIFNIPKVSIGTGIMMAFEPYSILLSSLLYSETIFTFLFLLFFYFLIRYFKSFTMRDLVWMSLFLGLATMSKLTIQYIPIVLIIFMLIIHYKNLGSVRWKNISIMLGIFLLLIIPWIGRNYVEFGKLGLSAQPPFNLYVYLVPTVLSIDNGTSFAVEHQNFVRRNNFDENNINLSNGDYYGEKALDILKDHKVALIKSSLTTIVTFFTHDGLLTVFQNAGIIIDNSTNRPALSMLFDDPLGLLKFIKAQMMGLGVLILIARLVWILITVLFIIGIIRFIRTDRTNPAVWMAIILVLYFMATTAINGLGVNARFKVPIEVFIFSFALYGLFSSKRHNTLYETKK